jgi:hypothetical protein
MSKNYEREHNIIAKHMKTAVKNFFEIELYGQINNDITRSNVKAFFLFELCNPKIFKYRSLIKKVICDETNNSVEVISENGLICDIMFIDGKVLRFSTLGETL